MASIQRMDATVPQPIEGNLHLSSQFLRLKMVLLGNLTEIPSIPDQVVLWGAQASAMVLVLIIGQKTWMRGTKESRMSHPVKGGMSVAL